jgi:riboflavin biosynthesis pyrimidine reductase
MGPSLPYARAGLEGWQDAPVLLAYLRSDPDQHGPLDDSQLVELYRHPRPAAGRLFLRTNFVASLDGSIQGSDGRSGGINTPSDQHVFALHRAHADAVLVGAGTARTEGYRAIDLAPWQREIRSREGLADYPTLVVVSRSLDLDPVVAQPLRGPGGPVMIMTIDQSAASLGRPFTDAGVAVTALGEGEVDLGRLVTSLAATGLRRVVCEGGPQLHRDLLAADLVDELSLTLAPTVVGGTGQRSTAGAALPTSRGFVPDLVLVAEDGAVFTRYARA